MQRVHGQDKSDSEAVYWEEQERIHHRQGVQVEGHLETMLLMTKEEKGAGFTFMAGLKGSEIMLLCCKGTVTHLPPKVFPPLLHWQQLSYGMGGVSLLIQQQWAVKAGLKMG